MSVLQLVSIDTCNMKSSQKHSTKLYLVRSMQPCWKQTTSLRRVDDNASRIVGVVSVVLLHQGNNGIGNQLIALLGITAAEDHDGGDSAILQLFDDI